MNALVVVLIVAAVALTTVAIISGSVAYKRRPGPRRKG